VVEPMRRVAKLGIWIGALLLGALVPASLAAALAHTVTVLPVAFVITLGHATILGLPALLIYRAARWTRLSAAIAGGLIIGMIPGGLLFWPVRLSLRSTASVDGIPTLINGTPTAAGWFQYVELLGTLGGYGALGAFVFWLALRLSGALKKAERGSSQPDLGSHGAGIWLAGVTIAASLAVAAIPIITKDRSCHSPFRDGPTSLIPKMQVNLDIEMGEWPKLTRVLEDFAASHGMSFRNSNQSDPNVLESLDLSLCNEQGLLITANDHRWATQGYAPDHGGLESSRESLRSDGGRQLATPES